MKVYVVTSGSYSDYGIEAVFLDRDKATVYCARHNEPEAFDYFKIEEYDLMDDNVESTGDDEIVYRMFVDSLGLKKPFVFGPDPMLKANVPQDIAAHHDAGRRYYPQNDFPYERKFVYLSEPVKEKARKIVQDRYAQWKAERAGI